MTLMNANHFLLASSGLEAVPPDTLKWTLIILIAVAILMMQLWDRFGRKQATNIEPDPLRVVKLDKFATRDFCHTRHDEITRRLDSHDAAIERIYQELKADRNSNQAHASERSKTLFNAIGDVRTELTEKIDAMPDRIIKLLNELGLLNKK